MGAQAHQRQDRASDNADDLPSLANTYVSYQNYRDKPTDQLPRQERLSALEIERAKGITSETESKKLDERAANLVARAASTREELGKDAQHLEVEKFDSASSSEYAYRLKSKLLFGLHATNFALQSFLAISHIVSGNGVWWLNVVAASCWGLCAAFQVERVRRS